MALQDSLKAAAEKFVIDFPEFENLSNEKLYKEMKKKGYFSDERKYDKKLAKGGEVKGYMGGGEVHMDDSPNSGMITQRGWGASRKT
jgi:hypothetical protein